MQFIASFKPLLTKSYLAFVLCLFLDCVQGYGQPSTNPQATDSSTNSGMLSKDRIHPLTIGDKMPDVEFLHMINYPSKTARLSDFKSKLTILDLWSSGCSACIGYFPYLQSLQDRFKDKLRIILINSKSALWHDNEIKIQGVLHRLQERSKVTIHLPVVFNCPALDDFFPYERIPHEVWLNEEGKVIAITGAEEITANNIQALLKGKQVAMHMKKDIHFDLHTHTLPELVYGNMPLSAKPLSSSVLVRGIIDGLGSGFGVRRANSPNTHLYTGWYAVNMPLIEIYRAGFGDKMQYPSNRIFIQTLDPGRFRESRTRDTARYAGDISMESNVYSYDIQAPPTSMEKLMLHVQNDLVGAFHATVINEQRKIRCYILRTTPQSVKSYTKGGEREYRMDKLEARKYIHNYPLRDLVRDVNGKYFNIPLIDETGLTRNVDIDMPSVLSQQNIILALEKAGFEVTEAERTMEVAAIIDK